MLLSLIDPFQWIHQAIAGEAWAYPLVLGVVTFEAVIPLIPGETAIITAAITAADGQLSILLVFAFALIGSVLGDNLSYLVGRRFGRRAYFAVARGTSAKERYQWASMVLDRYGAWILPAARFVPGGRTVITLASGAVELKWGTFLLWDLAAGVLWAAYASALGYVGGETFKQHKWAAFAVAFGIAGLITIAGWVYYRFERARA